MAVHTSKGTPENACEVAKCDNPEVRDHTSTDPLRVRVVYTVVNDAYPEDKLKDRFVTWLFLVGCRN